MSSFRVQGAVLSTVCLFHVFPPDQALDYRWEGHGFKVHIPTGAIS